MSVHPHETLLDIQTFVASQQAKIYQPQIAQSCDLAQKVLEYGYLKLPHKYIKVFKKPDGLVCGHVM